MNGVALASLLLGLDLVGHAGRARWYGLLLSVFGIAVGAAASAHYRRAANPLIDLSVLEIKTFATATLLGGSLFRMAISAPTFVLPLFLQVGLGQPAYVAGLLVLAHSAGDLGMKVVTTATIKRLGFRTALIASAAVFGLLIAALALVGAGTPLAVVLAILLISGAVRSLQMTGLSSLQFADVPREQLGERLDLCFSVNTNVTRALGIVFAALGLTTSGPPRGAGGGAISVFDFHAAFLAAGLLALAAMLRYCTLPADAGRHVSEGR